LQKLDVFKNYRNLLGYELTTNCAKAIDKIVETEQKKLLP